MIQSLEHKIEKALKPSCHLLPQVAIMPLFFDVITLVMKLNEN